MIIIFNNTIRELLLKEHSKSDIHQHTVGDDVLPVGERGVLDHHVTRRDSAKRSCCRGSYTAVNCA